MLQLFHDITEDHAFRLAAFLVARNGGKDEYSAVRGRGFSALFINHRKAQRCPHRGKFEGSPFTICERDAWLSHMRAAFEEVGVDKKAMEDQMSILTYVERNPTVDPPRFPVFPFTLTHMHAVHVDCRYMVRFYGPFVDDRAERAAEAAQQKKELEAKAKSAAAAGCPVAHHSKPEDATCPSGAGGGAGASSHATTASAAAQASTSGGSNKQKSKKRGVVESVKRLLQ